MLNSDLHINNKNIHSDSYNVIAPDVLCLYIPANMKNTLSFIYNIKSIPIESKTKINIDFSNVVTLNASAAVYIFSIISTRQIKNSNVFTFNLPKDRKIRRVFENSGFVTILKKGGLKKLSKLWKGNNNFVCGNNSDVKKCIDKIKDKMPKKRLPSNLSSALQETFLNINHHAYTDVSILDLTWWCYFKIGVDDKGEYLTATICDNGVGIPTTIKNAFFHYKTRNDSDCISYAMTETITSTQEDGRGKGSFDIQSPLYIGNKNQSNYIYILSSYGRYFSGPEELKKNLALNDSLSKKLYGTVIEWKIYSN